MGFKRPEVQILSPRPEKARKRNVSGLSRVLGIEGVDREIPGNSEKIWCTAYATAYRWERFRSPMIRRREASSADWYMRFVVL